MEIEELPPPWDDEESLEFYENEDEEVDTDTNSLNWSEIILDKDTKQHIKNLKQAFISLPKNRMSVLYINTVSDNEYYIAASSRKSQYGFRSGNLCVYVVRPSDVLRPSIRWLITILGLARCTGVYGIYIKDLFTYFNKQGTDRICIGKSKTAVVSNFSKNKEDSKVVASYISSNSILTDIEYIIQYIQDKILGYQYSAVPILDTAQKNELRSISTIVRLPITYPNGQSVHHYWIEGLDIFSVKQITSLEQCEYRYVYRENYSYILSYFYGKDKLAEYYLFRPYSVFFLT